MALAKSKPDSLNFAVSGMGGANHLAGIDFAQRAGIKWTYIPYKGGSQALTDMVGGQAQVMFNGALATYPFVKDGKLKALAVSSAKRFTTMPDIPTVAESAGMPGFETGSFQGIVAPANTPHAEKISFVTDQPGHDFRYSIDDAKVKRELGWTPKHSLEQGMGDTVAWYVENRAWIEGIRQRGFQSERLGLVKAS